MQIEELVLMLTLIFFSLNVKDDAEHKMILYLVAGIVTIIIVAGWTEDYPGIAVTLGGFSIYLIIRSIFIALQSGGPARGMSQFKGIWGQLKSLFGR